MRVKREPQTKNLARRAIQKAAVTRFNIHVETPQAKKGNN